jgi:hypothetical protein
MKNIFISVDVEADGPIPCDYSMICLGAVVVDGTFDKTFYAKIKPISDKYMPEALAVSGFSREETLLFDEPHVVMDNFYLWLQNIANNFAERLIFVSDNNGFDWQFVNWYLHHFCGKNPFGHSSVNIGSLYKGVVLSMNRSFKHLRKTKHAHNPVDDAKGNAEALWQILGYMEKYGKKSKIAL